MGQKFEQFRDCGLGIRCVNAAHVEGVVGKALQQKPGGLGRDRLGQLVVDNVAQAEKDMVKLCLPLEAMTSLRFRSWRRPTPINSGCGKFTSTLEGHAARCLRSSP